MDDPTRQDRHPARPAGDRDDRPPGGKLPIPARIALAALAVVLTVVLAVAGRLRPDPRGYGTHEQLGRPPCLILTLTGRPCPSCGMTTAFARFARGELAGAWRANPAGLLLAAAVVPLIPWLIACAAVGRPLGVRSAGEFLMALVVIAAAVAVLTWIVRRFLSLI